MTTLKEIVAAIDADLQEETSWMPMPHMPGNSQQGPDPLRLQAITQMLRDNPILIEPTLNWMNQKAAEISGATLQLLYTPEQLEEKRRQLEESESGG